MLTISHVRKTFNKGTINEKKALQGINLHLKPGDFVTVIGGNGAGKSTMLNMIAGVYPIDSGKIEIEGEVYEARATDFIDPNESVEVVGFENFTVLVRKQ